MNKQELRTQCKRLRDSLEKKEKKSLDKKILKQLLKTNEFSKAKVIALYYPTQSEVDLTAVMTSAKRKIYVFPKCRADGGLDFFKADNLNMLSRGAFNIMEPADGCEKIPVSEIDFMIIPGLVFGRDMHRIGYGKGFYDKVLCAEKNSFVKCGVAYGFQLMGSIPYEEHDIKMDMIICNDGIIMAKGI